MFLLLSSRWPSDICLKYNATLIPDRREQKSAEKITIWPHALAIESIIVLWLFLLILISLNVLTSHCLHAFVLCIGVLLGFLYRQNNPRVSFLATSHCAVLYIYKTRIFLYLYCTTPYIASMYILLSTRHVARYVSGLICSLSRVSALCTRVYRWDDNKAHFDFDFV